MRMESGAERYEWVNRAVFVTEAASHRWTRTLMVT
jgi:hypothetical protein